jgi:uncharacterized membrane protein
MKKYPKKPTERTHCKKFGIAGIVLIIFAVLILIDIFSLPKWIGEFSGGIGSIYLIMGIWGHQEI